MISFDEKLLEKNRNSEILSAYVAPEAMQTSLDSNAQHIKELARDIYERNPEHLILVGSGASYCTLYTGYYFLKTNSPLAVTHEFGPVIEFEGDTALLDSISRGKAYAIISSYSGKTADTVSVSKYLGKLGVPRIAISRDESGPLAQTCENVLAYHDKCLYTSAMANLLTLIGELLALRGEKDASERLLESLRALPEQMKSVIEKSETMALQALESVRGNDLFYVVGDGPLWALAYQYGYTNIMEYSRLHASCVRACEWRHGPLEILGRKPAMIHFIADDATREYSEVTRRYCEDNGAQVITFDVRDFFDTDSALAPFAVHAVSQLFLLYQATDLGLDMDSYTQMHVTPYKPGETYF